MTEWIVGREGMVDVGSEYRVRRYRLEGKVGRVNNEEWRMGWAKVAGDLLPCDTRYTTTLP